MGDRLPRKLAAIMYADVAGYSRLKGEDEDNTHRKLSEYLDLISAAIAEHQGRVVHYAGDSMSPHMVLAACLALAGDQEGAQAELAESKRPNPNLSLEFAAEQIPYRLPRDRERNLEGLRKAGLK